MEQKEIEPKVVDLIINNWEFPTDFCYNNFSNKFLETFCCPKSPDVKWKLELVMTTFLTDNYGGTLKLTLADFGTNESVEARITFSSNQLHIRANNFHHFTKDNREIHGTFSSYSTGNQHRIKKKKVMLKIKCIIEAKIFGSGHGRTSAMTSNPLNLIEPLLRDYEKIMRDGKFSDFKLITESGREFQVHRVVLSARSPVLAALFEHNSRENIQNSVRIVEISDDAVEEMLRYIYTGKVEKLEVLASELLSVSDKYGLSELKQYSEKFLCMNVGVDSAVSMLMLADSHGAAELKAQTLDFIAKNINIIIDTPGFKSLKETHWNLIQDILKILASK